MKKLILGFSLFFLPLLLSGIISTWAAPANKPRYVSLAPSTTEILFALGLDEEIVGVSTYCNWPQKAKGKEKIGGFSQVNAEKILSLKPDYIFCTGLEQAGIARQLGNLNLKIYVSDPKNMEELFDSIRQIGEITGKTEEAEGLIKKMKNEIKEVVSNIKPVPEIRKPKVFIEIWHDPLTTAGKGSFVDELIVLAGGVNIAADTKRAYSIFSPEEVIRHNPDCIILAYMDKERPLESIGKRLGWKEISAVKNNRLYNDIDPNILLRPGPRLVQGLKEVHKRLYP